MPTRQEVIAYLQQLTDRDISELFRQIPDQDHHGIMFRRAVVTITVSANVEDAPHEFAILAYEDKEHYAGIPEDMLEEHACESCMCGVCTAELLCHVKNAICPVCRTKVYLT